MSDLETHTAALDRACMATLGETIAYAADGATYVNKMAHVDYREGQTAYDRSPAIHQDISMTVLREDVAVRPPRSARIMLARMTGQVFSPVNVKLDQSGTHWEFDLQKV